MKKKIIIAHRGASGYLPEHTLVAKAMAYGMGADFLEQDVAITKDGRAVVVHDCCLDTVTNVKDIFPKRCRKNGRYYVIDFTLKEIKKLRVNERISESNWKVVFRKRFPFISNPESHLDLKISTLEEEIELIQGMNKSTGKNVGIYPELKAPRFHNEQGKDIAGIVIDIITNFGYKNRRSKCYVQCFDPHTLQYIKHDLKAKVKLIQLLAPNEWNETPDVDYERMLTPEGIKQISRYADGIGPWMNQVVLDKGKGKKAGLTTIVKEAHKAGLEVHPYTFRADELPAYARDFDHLLKVFFIKMNIDGLFTDFPDKVAAFLHKYSHPDEWDSDPETHAARSFFKH